MRSFHIASISASMFPCYQSAMCYSSIAQGICHNFTNSLIPYCRVAAVGTLSACVNVPLQGNYRVTPLNSAMTPCCHATVGKPDMVGMLGRVLFVCKGDRKSFHLIMFQFEVWCISSKAPEHTAGATIVLRRLRMRRKVVHYAL